jgi:hypothetical protein
MRISGTLQLRGEKSSPLQGEVGGVFGKIFKPPQPLLIKEGIEILTEGFRRSCNILVRNNRFL